MPEKKLGGGIVLRPNSRGSTLAHTFRLGLAYTLGNDSFYVEPGLVNDVLVPLNLMRMENIHQLQILTTARVDSRSKDVKGSHTFPHNRLIHNLRAGALHGVIGQACGLSREELAIGILADCMHDNFTCAGGDSWKDVNHQKTLFDEDEDFAGKIFRYYGDGWRGLCQKYGFDPKSAAQTMQEIIDGCGLRGEIHEIADTASYMLGDLEQISRLGQRHGNAEDFSEILSLAKRPWDIWNHVMEKDGHVVVTDALALNNFLLLRVLLWRNLYQNPGRKVLEMLMRHVVYPWLLKKKRIKIADLPIKDDSWLFSIVEEEMGWQEGYSHNLHSLGSFPKLKAFATWREALGFEEYLVKSNARMFTLVFSVKDFQRTNSKTDKYRVIGPDGRVDIFKKVYPQHAAVIDRIALESVSPPLPVNVAYTEQWWKSTDNLTKAWQEASVRWRNRK